MDCGEYREAAGATAENLICLTKVQGSFVHQSLSSFGGNWVGKFTVIQPCNAHRTLN